MSKSATIEIWERFGFYKGVARTWKRSFDGGRTWESVPWPSKELPFVLLGYSNEGAKSATFYRIKDQSK